MELPDPEAMHVCTVRRLAEEARTRGMKGDGGDMQAFMQRHGLSKAKAAADVEALPDHLVRRFVASLVTKAGSGAAEDQELAKTIRRHSRWEHRVRQRVGAGAWEAHPVGKLIARTLQSDGFKQYYGDLGGGMGADTPARYSKKALHGWGKGWVVTDGAPPQKEEECTGKGGGGKAVLLGLDCEMCATSKGGKELLSFSVVDGDGKGLINHLVKPRGKVLDLKTDITGVTKADLKGVRLKWKDARQEFLDLIARLQEGGQKTVVLVGHALHHDLKALRIDHWPVVDTSFLFRYKDLEKATPSLANAYKAVLGLELRTEGAVHSAFDDAAASVALVRHEMDRSDPTPPFEPPPKKVPVEQLRQLFMHNVPADCLPNGDASVLAAAFAGDGPKPAQLELVPGVPGAKTAKVVVGFATVEDANGAYKALGGRAGVDALGRPQKVGVPVQCPKSKFGPARDVRVSVRKMAAHGGLAVGKDKKPPRRKRPPQPKRKRQGAAAGGTNPKAPKRARAAHSPGKRARPSTARNNGAKNGTATSQVLSGQAYTDALLSVMTPDQLRQALRKVSSQS